MPHPVALFPPSLPGIEHRPTKINPRGGFLRTFEGAKPHTRIGTVGRKALTNEGDLQSMDLDELATRAPHDSFGGKLVRLPLSLVPRGMNISILTGINRGMRWVTGAGPKRACWIGNYEADHISALPKVVRPGMVVYDLGANAGYYTLALSRLVGESGHVYSFEPEAGNVYFLRRHIQMNRLSNVTIVQAAVSNHAGMVGFSGALSSPSGEIEEGGSYLIPAITLNEFVAAGNPPPAFLKMDIEGAEVMALEGASEVLAKARPIALVAPHSTELSDACTDALAAQGYRFTHLDCVTELNGYTDFMAFPR